MTYELLTTQAAKTHKGESLGWRQAIVYGAPHKLAKGDNMCPDATPGCISQCLRWAGRLKFDKATQAGIRRTKLFVTRPDIWAWRLDQEIWRFRTQCELWGMEPFYRLNGTTDADHCSTYRRHPNEVFVEYTKRVALYDAMDQLPNVKVVFSRSESNWASCSNVLGRGGSVAVVFAHHKLPRRWRGLKVIDGDRHDCRHLDPDGPLIVGLRAKDRAKGDTTGFVVR